MRTRITSAVAAIGLAVLLAAPAVAPAAAGELEDETIYAIFDQANMADIATGRLGWKKSRNADVRALARMVVTDHAAVQQMGRDLAADLGLVGTPPDGDRSWADQARALAELEELEERAFDEAYLRHEVAYHTAVIGAIKSTLLPAVENPRLRAVILEVLPGFEHHLAATKETADRLGVSY